MDVQSVNPRINKVGTSLADASKVTKEALRHALSAARRALQQRGGQVQRKQGGRPIAKASRSSEGGPVPEGSGFLHHGSRPLVSCSCRGKGEEKEEGEISGDESKRILGRRKRTSEDCNTEMAFPAPPPTDARRPDVSKPLLRMPAPPSNANSAWTTNDGTLTKRLEAVLGDCRRRFENETSDVTSSGSLFGQYGTFLGGSVH